MKVAFCFAGCFNLYFWGVEKNAAGFPLFKGLRKILIAIALIVQANTAHAQFEFSNSIDMGYPILLNSYNQNLYYQQLAVGLRFGVSYKPNATQFYPTVDFSFGRTRLPLLQFEHNVAFINYNYLNLMLKGNFVMNVFGENTLYLSMGIGFDKFTEKGAGISGKDAGQMKIRIDSSSNVTKLFPSVGLGLEYVYGESVGRKIYLSVGLNVRYTLLFDGDNNYGVYIRDAQGNDLNRLGAITGRVLIPDFHITLHYMPGKVVFFWKKKD